MWGKKGGYEEGKGMALAVPQRGSTLPESFVLRLYLFLAGGNLRGGLRGGFQKNIHQFYRCALSGSWSPLKTGKVSILAACYYQNQ